MTKISLVNLGCPKNLVDSESILGLLKEKGCQVTDELSQARVMLINTCAFIEEAKQESIDLVLELARLKKDSPQKRLVVIGCLVNRYLPELIKELPEVDLWVTLSEIPQLPELINNLLNGKSRKSRYTSPVSSHFLYNHTTPRYRITPPHYAYVKIAEGCSNRCSYCAVPDIKGPYRSREFNSILSEVKKLVKEGVKEINLIAQDTTSYGKDLEEKPTLPQLLRTLCKIDNLKWIRLLYTHPAHITGELITEIAVQPKICKYIDLPLQHIDDQILDNMNRKVDSKCIRNLIKKIRKEIPGVVLRTSLIVGLPGETEEKFQMLLEFMEETRFERLGVFTYSSEEGTPASRIPEQVPENVKEERYHRAMQAQQVISTEVNRGFFGKTLEVLVENPPAERENHWTTRSYADAPEVDGWVYVKCNGNNLHPGDITPVKIVDTLEYDLVGEPI